MICDSLWGSRLLPDWYNDDVASGKEILWIRSKERLVYGVMPHLWKDNNHLLRLWNEQIEPTCFEGRCLPLLQDYRYVWTELADSAGVPGFLVQRRFRLKWYLYRFGWNLRCSGDPGTLAEPTYPFTPEGRGVIFPTNELFWFAHTSYPIGGMELIPLR